jgi:hypothetical protein
MARGERVVETDKSGSTDLEPYYRLIEMQKQMIDLIQQNAHTERECAALRERLAREVEALAYSRRSLPERLRNSASGLIRRLLGRNGQKREDARDPFATGWSQPFGEPGSLPESQRPALNSRNSSCAVS